MQKMSSYQRAFVVGGSARRLLTVCLLSYLCACSQASEQPTPEAAKRFLKLRGYEFDSQSFFTAAAAGDEMAVNGFLGGGMNPNAKDEDGDTALTAAAARGDVKILNALIKGGADVNAKGRNDWTPLLLALQGKQDSVSEVLLARNDIDLKAESPEGMTALMIAVWTEKTGFVRLLLDRGADVNHQDKDGDTAVHGAAMNGDSRLLQLLLDHRANPNIRNRLGGTALMWAASYGYDEAVQVLLSKGADARIKDVDGVTAAGWAAKNGRGNLVIALREAEKLAKSKGKVPDSLTLCA